MASRVEVLVADSDSDTENGPHRPPYKVEDVHFHSVSRYRTVGLRGARNMPVVDAKPILPLVKLKEESAPTPSRESKLGATATNEPLSIEEELMKLKAQFFPTKPSTVLSAVDDDACADSTSEEELSVATTTTKASAPRPALTVSATRSPVLSPKKFVQARLDLKKPKKVIFPAADFKRRKTQPFVAPLRSRSSDEDRDSDLDGFVVYTDEEQDDEEDAERSLKKQQKRARDRRHRQALKQQHRRRTDDESCHETDDADAPIRHNHGSDKKRTGSKLVKIENAQEEDMSLHRQADAVRAKPVNNTFVASADLLFRHRPETNVYYLYRVHGNVFEWYQPLEGSDEHYIASGEYYREELAALSYPISVTHVNPVDNSDTVFLATPLRVQYHRGADIDADSSSGPEDAELSVRPSSRREQVKKRPVHETVETRQGKQDLASMRDRWTRADLKEVFPVYIQYMVSCALDKDFAEAAKLDADEYFARALHRMHNELQDRKTFLIDSSAWKVSFKEAIERFPDLMQQPVLECSGCDACLRAGHRASVQVTLGGTLYNQLTMQPVKTQQKSRHDRKSRNPLLSVDSEGDSASEHSHGDESSDSEQAVVRVFSLGRQCAVRAALYHRLHHFPRHLYVSCFSKLRSLRRKSHVELTDKELLNICLDDDSWMDRVWKDLQMLVKETDTYCKS